MSHAYIGIKCVGFRGPRALPNLRPPWNSVVSAADRDALVFRVASGESMRGAALSLGMKIRAAYAIIGPVNNFRADQAKSGQ